MKKFLSVLTLLVCTLVHAEYTPENKIIKVVIPQSASSGLGTIYNHLEAYARKQNINLVPVYKPGANAKIGLSYASEQKNDGNTLLFSTLSDFVESANDTDFDKVAPVTKATLVLVASSKSKIKDIKDIVAYERAKPGQLTWAYVSSAHFVLIKSVIRANNLNSKQVYTVPFSSGPGYQTSLANGDVDLGFMVPSTAEALASKGYVTIVSIDDNTRQEMSKKENGTALFLPKNTSDNAKTFWNKFIKGLESDTEFKQATRPLRIDTYKNADPADLEKIIADWRI